MMRLPAFGFRPGRLTAQGLTQLGIATLIAVASARVGGASPPSAAFLLRDIERRGARPVLWELSKDDARFFVVLDQIETGRREWLEVARRLKLVSDAGDSLSLNYSVARALLKQPERVLGLVGRGFELDDICTSPFIEPEESVAERYERKALKVLADLDRSAAGPRARECASLIRLPR